MSLEKKGKKIYIRFYNEADNVVKGKLDVLFERFYRTDASRNYKTGGSGIGLSVAIYTFYAYIIILNFLT